jgi:hypothetical protein
MISETDRQTYELICDAAKEKNLFLLPMRTPDGPRAALCVLSFDEDMNDILQPVAIISITDPVLGCAKNIYIDLTEMA